MMVMVVVMMMMHRSGRGSGGLGAGGRRSAWRRSRGGFLSDGVSREADRENGRAYETLDHGKAFLLEKRPLRVIASIVAMRLNST
jgi:hypothetical protein